MLLPFKIKVYGVWRAENHHLLEKTLHEIYDPQRINGEWFEFTSEHLAKIFESLPSESLIHSSRNSEHSLTTFTNVTEDIRNSKKVIGVRTQKLRGDFTPEEREAIRKERMEQKKEFKRLGLTGTGNKKVNLVCRSCERKNIDPSRFCSHCGTSLEETGINSVP